MNWLTLAQLIAQYGLPFAQKIWTLITSGGAPTQAEWDALNLLAAQTARTKMLDALAKAGVDPASPQGQALLAITPA